MLYDFFEGIKVGINRWREKRVPSSRWRLAKGTSLGDTTWMRESLPERANFVGTTSTLKLQEAGKEHG